MIRQTGVSKELLIALRDIKSIRESCKICMKVYLKRLK